MRAFMETAAVGVSKDMASTVFPGFKFSPTDVELISYYLKRKMDGLEKSVKVIPETDIYSFEPWDLPGLSLTRFFTVFSSTLSFAHLYSLLISSNPFQCPVLCSCFSFNLVFLFQISRLLNLIPSGFSSVHVAKSIHMVHRTGEQPRWDTGKSLGKNVMSSLLLK